MHMRMRSIIFILLSLPLLFSCSDQERLPDSPGEQENIPAGIARVAFRSGPLPQSVYIFRKEGNVFRYDSTLKDGWSAEGKMTARLPIGDYKFLFTGPLDGEIDLLPASLDKTVTPEQLRFVSRPVPEQGEYLLPPAELFLPEPDVADSVYEIRGEDVIECTLKRRVSQIGFVLKRGYKEGNEYVPLPYTEGHDILETIGKIQVKISGVGRECNYLGTSGEGTIFCEYEASRRDSVDSQGFAAFGGPFVFPPAANGDVRLAITLTSVEGDKYPALELTSKLEANRKLMVNLWLGSSYFDVGVTIHNVPISGKTAGDTGAWE